MCYIDQHRDYSYVTVSSLQQKPFVWSDPGRSRCRRYHQITYCCCFIRAEHCFPKLGSTHLNTVQQHHFLMYHVRSKNKTITDCQSVSKEATFKFWIMIPELKVADHSMPNSCKLLQTFLSGGSSSKLSYNLLIITT